ncbi:NADH-quinone oxidoreductase subunit NuoI [Mycolicibacterium aubagnense]
MPGRPKFIRPKFVNTLGVTFGTMFKKSVTEQYPRNPPVAPRSYRRPASTQPL